jgi:hypothetical protein
MGDIRVYARSADGTETDITEGVAALYDLVIGSMNWGSGFLTVEDALPVVHVAMTCQFKDYERAEEYVRAEQHSVAQQQFLAEREPPRYCCNEHRVGHDHVYSPAGKCMWPGCRETRQPDPLPAPQSAD